ncbi:MAG: dihydropteroate synthase [Thermoplasmata archaeon]|nr:MAG: dihydropteroate synthase [Thermoplasmata archaeon]
MKIGKKVFRWGERTYIMGVLNVTPDSFSDGGRYLDPERAVERALEMQAQGADIIDVGGESTRPGSERIGADEELKRVKPVLEEICDKLSVPVSIDTYKSEVAEAAIRAGAAMINDISALRFDSWMVNVVKEYDVPVVLMHMKGTPKGMQENPHYDDVMHEIISFLHERKEFAVNNGIDGEKIIVDPGIGFGKRTGKGIEDNCEIIGRLRELKVLGSPILVGPSRKTFIGNVCSDDDKPLPVDRRIEGTLAAVALSAVNGADIVRVHDVAEARRCLKLVDSIIRKTQI